MKIFYLANAIYNSAGLERVLILKANLLATKYGYEVVIVTNHQKGRPTFFPLDPHVRHVDLGVNIHMPWNRGRYIRALKALIREEKPDIVNSLVFQEFTHLHKLRGLCPVIMAELHFAHDSYLVKGKRIRLRRYEKEVAVLDCFVVLTREDREAWSPYCPHLEQIYNPLTFTSSEQAPLQAKRAISAGRFDKQKNYASMVHVWKKVHERHPDWILDLYGNGRKKGKIMRLIRQEGLEEVIRVHPAICDVKSEMLGSSMYLMTSLYEGFPMVLLETAAVGLPCVCMRCPCGPSEFIEDGISGMLADQGDIGTMADKICTLIENPGLRQRMGRAVNAKTADYTQDKILDQWDRLFKRLVASKAQALPLSGKDIQ